MVQDLFSLVKNLFTFSHMPCFQQYLFLISRKRWSHSFSDDFRSQELTELCATLQSRLEAIPKYRAAPHRRLQNGLNSDRMLPVTYSSEAANKWCFLFKSSGLIQYWVARRGFAAIHMLIGAVCTSASSTCVMVRFRQYVAQTNKTFTGCKLLLTAEN